MIAFSRFEAVRKYAPYACKRDVRSAMPARPLACLLTFLKEGR